MTPVRPGLYGLLFACLALMGATLLWPTFAPSRGVSARATACLSNVKQTALGLIMYMNDYDDRLPQRDEWMDRDARSVSVSVPFRSRREFGE